MLLPSLEASRQNENLEILLQNTTPHSGSSAVVSQDFLSQHLRNSETPSQHLVSQSSHLSPSNLTFILNIYILTPQVKVPQIQPTYQKESLNNPSHLTEIIQQVTN